MSGLEIDILFTNNPLEETIDIVIQNMSVKRKINVLNKSYFENY